MVKFGTYDVCVAVDNEQLPEFDVVVEEEERKVTCWIPSEAGKAFSVHFNNEAPFADGFPAKGAELFLDGVLIASRTIKARGARNEREESSVFSRASYKSGVYREFLFAACELTDDDSLFLESKARRLGEIELKITEAVEVPEAVAEKKRPTARQATTIPPLKIHEKAKKGMVHGVQLSEPILPEPPRVVPSKSSKASKPVKQPAKPLKKPVKTSYDHQGTLATFVFRFCSLELLQAKGIAPRPRKPQSEVAESTDVIDLTLSDEDEDEDDDVREAEIAALKARIEVLERTRIQKQTKVPPTRKRVKSEEQENINPVVKRERLGY